VRQTKAALWPGQSCIWEASDPYLYIRTTPEGRVICGGGDAEFSDETKRDALTSRKCEMLRRKLHYRLVCKTYWNPSYPRPEPAGWDPFTPEERAELEGLKERQRPLDLADTLAVLDVPGLTGAYRRMLDRGSVPVAEFYWWKRSICSLLGRPQATRSGSRPPARRYRKRCGTKSVHRIRSPTRYEHYATRRGQRGRTERTQVPDQRCPSE
jgi:hypothetical protein